MSAPVLDAGVWHAPICGALLPCASEAIALSVLEVHRKNSPFYGLEPPAPEPVEVLDEESEEMKQCIYFQCQLPRVEGAAQGYEFCERHMKKAANLLGWPLETLLEPSTEKEKV